MNDEYHVPTVRLNFATCHTRGWMKPNTLCAVPREGNIQACSENITECPACKIVLSASEKSERLPLDENYIFNKVDFKVNFTATFSEYQRQGGFAPFFLFYICGFHTAVLYQL
jgi:hypothetical protein